MLVVTTEMVPRYEVADVLGQTFGVVVRSRDTTVLLGKVPK
jgi:uncharacterized protein YbjQ (UPF0145 family)